MIWLRAQEAHKRIGPLVSWCRAMQEFVRNANIAEFRKLLLKTTDEYQRRTLLQLLAEEKAKAPLPLKMKARGSDD